MRGPLLCPHDARGSGRAYEKSLSECGGSLQVADFNLSRAMKGMEMVPTSGVINSPEWAAPERLSGQAYGRSSDVFRSASYLAAHACVQFGSLGSSKVRFAAR